SEITTPHGDNHDVWINPDNTQVMVQGNDGGANVSFNGGRSWSTIYNQLTGQFYRLATDNQFPYRVYGTQQDNSSISTPSRLGIGAIPWGDSYAAGTGESGHIVVHPDNSDLVFVGAIGSSAGGGNALQKYDHKSKQLQLVTIWPEDNRGKGAKDWKYRFQWTYPIRFSPHDPNILYAAGNHLFRSTNEGQSWEIISPDLSRNDEETLLPSGGPINLDTTGAENYATIFSFEESPHEAGVFWAGTDDGLVHISKDHGQTWTDVTPADLPYRTMVHTLEISPHDPATCYLACTKYKLDDYNPYLFKTNDYGQTWMAINNGIRENDFTRVLREDPAKRGLLYVGTETGMYVSFNDGEQWHPMGGNLPVVPIYDMQRKNNDLVLATHGRAFWIMDDVTFLHDIEDDSAVKLFSPAPSVRIPAPAFRSFMMREGGKLYMLTLGATATVEVHKNEQDALEWTHHDCGTDAPEGVVLNYFLPEAVKDAIKLTILDSDGNEIKSFRSQKKDDKDMSVRLSAKAGLNRFEWDMRYENAKPLEGEMIFIFGPTAQPGSYSARLDVGEESQTVSFEILKDPRIPASGADLKAQFDLLLSIRDKQSAVHETAGAIKKIKAQIAEWGAKAEEDSPLAKSCEAVANKLTNVEDVLVQTKGGSFFDMNHESRLANQLSNLPMVVSSADTAPTQQSIDAYAEAAAIADSAIDAFNAIMGDDLAALNDLIRAADVPAIAV
ncbi:MAG: WD40/YVTN/BNR-like repeat-containing protein, partial [Anaerolineae bacterium]